MLQENIAFLPQDSLQVLPFPTSTTPSQKLKSLKQVKELVFVGELSLAGGLKVFCDAIDTLLLAADTFDYQITFMGRSSEISDLQSSEYIELRALNWEADSVKWNMKADVDVKDILAYLSQASMGRLAVMPSIPDISSVVEQELLNAGIPFVGSSSSSIRDYVSEKWVVEPLGPELADKLAAVFDSEGIYSSLKHQFKYIKLFYSFCFSSNEDDQSQ